MSSIDRLPDGRMKDALREQEPAFAEEMAKRYLDADPESRVDISAFFDSDGPRKIHEAKLRILDGIPTAADLGKMSDDRCPIHDEFMTDGACSRCTARA